MNKRKGLKKETKELYSSLGRSFFLCFVALFAIVTATVAWFASNTNVQGSNTSVSASGENRFYLATKKEGSQGLYDDNSNNNLYNALKYFKRIGNETVNGFPTISIGRSTIKGNDGIDYIVGDDVSLMVNSTSNVNNTVQNDYIGPGSRGEITFYIIPVVEGNNTVDINLTLTPYGLVKQDNIINAQQINDDTLKNLLYGHIYLFRGKDNSGYYTNQIEPAVGSDGVFQFSLSYTSDEWVRKTPVAITLYWVWPYRFENLIFPGQPGSLFPTNNDDQTNLIKWINLNKDKIVNNVQDENFADIKMYELSNANFTKWSNGYNSADQYIGDRVAYFVWAISTHE